MRICCAEVAAAAVCLVVVSSSSTLSVEASANHVRVHEQQQQKLLRAGEAAVDIAHRNKNSHKKDANRIRRRMEVAGRYLHEKKNPWHDPDLYGDEGGHHIVDAEPIERTQHIVDATPIELSPAPGEGRNANAEANEEEYDGEVMLHAQVESGDVDDWATRSPTASPFSPLTREDDAEVEICITEVCFLGECSKLINAHAGLLAIMIYHFHIHARSFQGKTFCIILVLPIYLLCSYFHECHFKQQNRLHSTTLTTSATVATTPRDVSKCRI